MGKGTGLGLALVWGVVKKARGTVTVESQVGTGSTFSIFLPLSVKRPKSTSTTVRPEHVHGRGTVLVIDDEPAVRTSTTRMLERLGLRTLAAGGGVEGLALFDQRAADIGMVVLDMGMPGMNGAEVFRALRQRGGVHVLIATGYALEEEVQQLVAAGARLIEKPFKLEALELEVARALPRAHSRQVAQSSA
jgi:CheY-like chemotaxis protein